MSKELKPCPFCNQPDRAQHLPTCWFYLKNIGASRARLAQAWNRRAPTVTEASATAAAPGASIDTNEFRKMLDALAKWDDVACRDSIIAHINAHVRAQLFSERQAKEYEQRHAVESEKALAQVQAQLALAGNACLRSQCGARQEPVAWLDRDGRMTDELRSFIEGMSVSMDVSTGEHDAENRYFGIISEVMDDNVDKNGVTLLVYDAQPNFASPVIAQGAPKSDAKRMESDGGQQSGKGAAANADDLSTNAARYLALRRKVCIAGWKFQILNLDPTYCAPNAAVELDAVLDAYILANGEAMGAASPVSAQGTPDGWRNTIDTAAGYLEHYAKYCYEVKPDEIERHPYIPAIEQVAEELRSYLAAAPAQAQDGAQPASGSDVGAGGQND